ncbi:MAG TPA: helix-turn-helix domain-containing protein [Pseudonocardiaceae bacterium]|nr:helix-turn-helix domain-containing protein [Pseudonocardiaceae bacterium]
MIAEEGFAKASLARVAQRAGVAKSAVLYHFASKDELVQQVLLAVSMASIESFPARMADATTALDKLRASIETIVDFIDKHRNHAPAGLETWNQTRSLPARARLAADPAGRDVDGIRELLLEGQRTGESGEFDPHVLAVMFRQAIDAATLEVALNPDADVVAFSAELVAMFERATRK